MLLVWGGDVCFVEVNSVVSTLTVLLVDVLCVNFCAGLVVGFVSVQFASSKGKKNKKKQNNHHSTCNNDFETLTSSGLKMNIKKILVIYL